ncbi:MAG: hypothetical protein LRY68_10005, partial [Sulfurospirillum sp.]|nr:hypothetical protein [Sulfurospirillum sp.]
FVLTYAILIIKPFDINKTLNKEFKRYKKYLRLKRKHHGKTEILTQESFQKNIDLYVDKLAQKKTR